MVSMERQPERKAQRFAASLPAVLHERGRDYPCDALNLSRTGVLLVGALPEPGSPDVELTLQTPTADLELRLFARLAHRGRDDESGETKLGVQFLNLDPSQAEAIDQMVARVVEGMAPAALDGLDRGASLAECRAALEKIPLAHRIILARRAQVREREVLRHDADPQVLEALARNPSIVLPEIIALLRMHSLLPSTVEIIANDSRWAHSDEARILVATHPRASFTTADRAVARLSDMLLQRVVHRPGLNPAVREKVMRRLSRKHRG
jgi:hypothetical protein